MSRMFTLIAFFILTLMPAIVFGQGIPSRPVAVPDSSQRAVQESRSQQASPPLIPVPSRPGQHDRNGAAPTPPFPPVSIPNGVGSQPTIDSPTSGSVALMMEENKSLKGLNRLQADRINEMNAQLVKFKQENERLAQIISAQERKIAIMENHIARLERRR